MQFPSIIFLLFFSGPCHAERPSEPWKAALWEIQLTEIIEDQIHRPSYTAIQSLCDIVLSIPDHAKPGQFDGWRNRIGDKAITTLENIPGYADHLKIEILNPENTKSGTKRSDHDFIRGAALSQLAYIPTPETVKVLGELLFTDIPIHAFHYQGNDGKCRDYTRVSECAAAILNEFQIESAPPLNSDGVDLQKWRDWFASTDKLRNGFRFDGDPTLYRAGDRRRYAKMRSPDRSKISFPSVWESLDERLYTLFGTNPTDRFATDAPDITRKPDLIEKLILWSGNEKSKEERMETLASMLLEFPLYFYCPPAGENEAALRRLTFTLRDKVLKELEDNEDAARYFYRRLLQSNVLKKEDRPYGPPEFQHRRPAAHETAISLSVLSMLPSEEVIPYLTALISESPDTDWEDTSPFIDPCSPHDSSPLAAKAAEILFRFRIKKAPDNPVRSKQDIEAWKAWIIRTMDHGGDYEIEETPGTFHLKRPPFSGLSPKTEAK